VGVSRRPVFLPRKGVERLQQELSGGQGSSLEGGLWFKSKLCHFLAVCLVAKMN
jgi:hypothetical protein